MREAVLGLGVIMIFAGVMVLPVSIQSFPEIRTELRVEREFLVFPDWVISAWFNRSQQLAVFFSDPTRPGEDTIPDDSSIIFVNITDPTGGVTKFNITFYRTTVEVYMESNDGGLLVEDPSSQGVGGIAQYDGEYTARVYTWVGVVPYYYADNTMRRLRLYEVIEMNKFPYIIGLPAAAALIAGGGMLVVWSARSPKRRPRPKVRR